MRRKQARIFARGYWLRIFCAIFSATVALVLTAAQAWAANADDLIWTLHLSEGHLPDCSLQHTRIAKDDRGQPCLDVDSRNDKIAWHSCLTLPKDLLKIGQDYRVRINYQVIDRPGEDSYFYVFARSPSLNRGKALTESKMRGSIRAELGGGLWVEGNTWITGNGVVSPKLYFDPETTQRVVCKDNRLQH